MTNRSDEKQLPPWLRGVPLPARPPEAGVDLRAATSSAPISPMPGGSESEGVPDWLSALADSPSMSSPDSLLSSSLPEQAQDLPDWLTNLSSSIDQADSSAGSVDSAEDIPDWLRSSESAPAMPQSPPPNQPSSPASPGRMSASSGFTGWLSPGNEPTPPPPIVPSAPPIVPPTPSAVKETRAAEELPSWLNSAIDSSSSDDSSESLPDWLQSLEPQPVDRSSETVAAPPSWMTDPAPVAPEASTPPPMEATPPSWLQSSVPSVPPLPAPIADEETEGLPNWLQSISDDDIRRVTDSDDSDLGVAPFSFGSESDPLTPSAAPGWLAALPDSNEQRASGEASEWLGASASQLIQAQTPITPDVPDWLRDAASDDSDDEAPAWLRGPESPTTSASDLTISPGSVAADVPVWLRDAPGTTPEEVQPIQIDDVPAWLRDSGPTIAAQTAPIVPSLNIADAAPQPALPPPDQPAWLSGVSTPPGVAPITASASDDLPDWLQLDAPQAAAPPVAPAASDELPAWLRDSATPTVDTSANSLPPWLRDESGQPMPSAMAPGDINLPIWLRGAETPSGSVSPSVPPLAQPSSLDWFEDTGKQASPATSSELLGGADLPAWLRSETERPRESNAVDARSLDWLARLGAYDDDTPIPATVDSAPRLILPAPPTRTLAQIESLALLRRMASTPFVQTAVASEPVLIQPLNRISIERVLSLLLLVILLVGLGVPGLATTIVGPSAAPSPAAAALLEQIKPLGENDIVLIGYEWDAQRVSELRPLERAVIEQLIAQRVKLVLVSTDPQGTMLQFDLRDRLNAAKYQSGGLDYVLLGYRPGGEIGLRQLAQNLRGALRSDFQGFDATIGALATNLSTSQPRLSTLNDFAMAIVFADEPTDVQGWMEQIRPAMQKPIAFLVPAGVQPISQPYFRQPGIFSLAGMQGALAYEQLRGGTDTTQTMLQSSQLRLATLLFCALLALGLVIVLVRTAINRPRSQP